MSIYIAHRRKNASNAFNVPSTDQKDTSSVYDENSQFACPAHANCFGTSSMSLVQRQRRCNGRTYRTETVTVLLHYETTPYVLVYHAMCLFTPQLLLGT